jgi:hypothetical protein
VTAQPEVPRYPAGTTQPPDDPDLYVLWLRRERALILLDLCERTLLAMAARTGP